MAQFLNELPVANAISDTDLFLVGQASANVGLQTNAATLVTYFANALANTFTSGGGGGSNSVVYNNTTVYENSVVTYIAVEDDAGIVSNAATSLTFTGNAVSVTNVGDLVTVTINNDGGGSLPDLPQGYLFAQPSAGTNPPVARAFKDIFGDYFGSGNAGATVYYDLAAGQWQALAHGSAGQVLTVGPSYDSPVWADLPTGNAGSTAWDFAPPLANSFVANVGSIVPSMTNDPDVGLLLDSGSLSGATGDLQRYVYKTTVPGTGSWSVTIKAKATIVMTNYNAGGLVLLESSTNKTTIFGREWGNQENYRVGNLTSPTGFGGNAYDAPTAGTDYQWFRIHWDDTAGVESYQVSKDGKFWSTIYTRSTTAGTYWTSRPDCVGLGFSLNINTSISNCGLSVSYWNQSW
jgi:hypothetical protein